jgi:hypothetical protein
MSTEETDERFRSRKWILFLSTAVVATVGATLLVLCRLIGLEAAPDVSSTLSFWSLTMGAVLGGYSTVNLIQKKQGG